MNRKELIYMGIIIICIISVIAVAWVLISSNKEEKTIPILVQEHKKN